MTSPTSYSTVTRCPWTFKPLSDPTAAQSEYTGRDLPQGWANSGSVCIAMAGARASGKSLYIAVLVKQLQQLAEKHGRVVVPADASTEERYREHYEEPLFEQMGLMPPTPSHAAADAYQRDPLIFNLGDWDLGDGSGTRPWFLVLRDVAGEDLESPPDDVSNLEFFRDADEVVFLFDPLKVSQIRNYLQGIIPEHQLGGDPVKVLDNLFRILGQARPNLAITLSKFDTLQKLEEVPDAKWARMMGNYGAAYRRDTGFTYNRVDQDLLNIEIRSMLMWLQAQRLVYTIDSRYTGQPPSSYRFFATSALGAAPQGSHLHRSGIAPFRVLDPVLWQLADRGLFR